MRQVPFYAILGAGRMARHFCHYLSLLGIPYRQWSRDTKTPLEEVISDCSSIIVLISDSAIETFIRNHPCLTQKNIIHFSGQLNTPLAFSAHPLMTFGDHLYTLETYLQIPFILSQNQLSFAELFPGLNNPAFMIPENLKPFYHALCVLSGNFTTILWQKFFSELEQTFNIPAQVGHLYLQKICENLQQNNSTALTGPLVRNDQNTIQANLNALRDDPFQKIYQAFLQVYSTQGVQHEHS